MEKAHLEVKVSYSTIKRYTPLRRSTSFIKRSPLKRSTCPIKRTPIRKIGKIGKRNAKADRNLAKEWVNRQINWCEPGLEGCIGTVLGLQNIHRHRRHWYITRPELLYSINQVVRGCQHCHDRIDGNTMHENLTDEEVEELFTALRGPEDQS